MVDYDDIEFETITSGTSAGGDDSRRPSQTREDGHGAHGGEGGDEAGEGEGQGEPQQQPGAGGDDGQPGGGGQEPQPKDSGGGEGGQQEGGQGEGKENGSGGQGQQPSDSGEPQQGEGENGEQPGHDGEGNENPSNEGGDQKPENREGEQEENENGDKDSDEQKSTPTIQSKTLSILTELVNPEKKSDYVHNYFYYTFPVSIQNSIARIVLNTVGDSNYLPKEFEELDKATAKAILIFIKNHPDFYKENSNHIGAGQSKYIYWLFEQLGILSHPESVMTIFNEGESLIRYISYHYFYDELDCVTIIKTEKYFEAPTIADRMGFYIIPAFKEANRMNTGDSSWKSGLDVIAELNNYKTLPLEKDNNELLFITAADQLYPLFKTFTKFVHGGL